MTKSCVMHICLVALVALLCAAPVALAREPCRLAPKGSFTSIKNPAKFSLKQTGIGTPDYVRAQELQTALHPNKPSPVGIAGVLGETNRTVTPLLSRDNRLLGNPSSVQGVNGAIGYGFDNRDNLVRHWVPQGITGSEDADLSGAARGTVAGRHVQAISWHHAKPKDTTVRITFVNTDIGKYRHVLPGVPSGGDRFSPIPIHAGGIAWVGKYMYVVDTDHGIRVFDTTRIVEVPKSRLKDYGTAICFRRSARSTEPGER